MKTVLPEALKNYEYDPSDEKIHLISTKSQNQTQSTLNPLKKIVTKMQISGQLVHPNQDPFNSQKIALFSPGCFTDDRIEGASAKTDADGNFTITYDLKHRPYEKTQNVLLQIFADTIPSEVGLTERMIDSIPIKIPIHTDRHDIGKIQTKFYESQNDFPILQVDNLSHRPQHSTTEFYVNLVTSEVRHSIKTLAGTLAKVFSEEEGKRMLSERKNVKLNMKNTLDFFLNGIHHGHLRKGKNENELINVIDWSQYKEAPPPPLLPDAKMTVIQENDKVKIKDITIRLDDNVDKEYIKENPLFAKVGQYLYNSTAFLKGEAEDHLLRGHLMAGQIALSFFRHIHNHPIKRLLEPHLQGVSEINRLAAGLIFGEKGILTLSALPQPEINEFLKRGLGSLDFATYSPQKPLGPEHRFARAQQLFWKVVTEVVDQFFEENKEDILSPATWHELWYMSQNLMKQSLPYQAYEPDVKTEDWVDRSEIDQPEVPGRVEYNGHIRAIRPFITSKDTPNVEDLEKVKQLCRYSMFICTFYHWAIHMSQDWGTNIDFASLAPELKGEGVNTEGTTDFVKAVKQTRVGNVLINFNAPKIMENKDGSIYAPFITKLRGYEKEFAELGYDINEIHSAIWI